MSEIDLQPDVHEILQEEAPETVDVPVCITGQNGPLRVQNLPRKGGATFTRTLTTDPLRILTADPRRAWARVRAADVAGTVALALTEAAAQDLSTMAEIPGLESEQLDAVTEVWVRAVTGTARVSVITSLWAEGEGPRG